VPRTHSYVGWNCPVVVRERRSTEIRIDSVYRARRTRFPQSELAPMEAWSNPTFCPLDLLSGFYACGTSDCRGGLHTSSRLGRKQARKSSRKSRALFECPLSMLVIVE
jgi:hypothetical protein